MRLETVADRDGCPLEGRLLGNPSWRERGAFSKVSRAKNEGKTQ